MSQATATQLGPTNESPTKHQGSVTENISMQGRQLGKIEEGQHRPSTCLSIPQHAPPNLLLLAPSVMGTAPGNGTLVLLQLSSAEPCIAFSQTQPFQHPILHMPHPYQPGIPLSQNGTFQHPSTTHMPHPQHPELTQTAQSPAGSHPLYSVNWVPPSFEVVNPEPEPVSKTRPQLDTLVELLSRPTLKCSVHTPNGPHPPLLNDAMTETTTTTRPCPRIVQDSPLTTTPIVIQPITSPCTSRTLSHQHQGPPHTSAGPPGVHGPDLMSETPYRTPISLPRGVETQRPTQTGPYSSEAGHHMKYQHIQVGTLRTLLNSPPNTNTRQNHLSYVGPAPKNPPPLRSVILRKVREVIEGKANAIISAEKGNSNARAPQNNTSPKGNLELPVVECVKEEPHVDNIGPGSFTKEANLEENPDINNHTRFEENKTLRTSSPDSSLEGREPKQEPDSPKVEKIKDEPNMDETLEKCKCEDTSTLTDSGMLCDLKENSSPVNRTQCDNDKNDGAEIPTLDMSVEVEQPTSQEDNISEAQANPSSKKSSDRKRKLFQDVSNTSLLADSKQSPRGLLAGKEKCAESGGKRPKLSDSQQSKSPDELSHFRTPTVFVEKEKTINAPSKGFTKAASSKTRERKRKLFEESDVLNTAFIADDKVQPSGRQPEKEKRDKNAGKFPRGKISQLSKKQNLLDVPRFSTKVTSWGPNPPSKTFHNQFHSKAPRSQNLFGDFDVFNTAFLADDEGSPYDHLPDDLKKYHMGLTSTRKTDEKEKKINKNPRPEPKKTETATKEKKKKQQEIKHYSVNDYDFYAFFETSSEDEESLTQEYESDDEDWAPDPEPEPIFVNPFKKKKGQNVKNHQNNRDSAKKESTGEKKQVFECDQCDRTFDDCWASMCAHRIQEHPSIEPHTCEICQIPCFDDTGLIKHMSEVHSIAGFVERKLNYIFCPDCDEKHPLGLTYLFHREESHECCILTCNLCDFTAHHRFQMKTHMQKVHDKIYFKNYSGDVTLKKVATREIPPPQSLRPYSCCLCGEEIVKGESMKHKKEKHLEELKLGFYHCVVCEKVFHSLHSISSHFLTHFKTTKCPICSTIFRNYGKEYREHIKTVHCGIKHTHCEECDVILARHSGTDHFRKVHENKRRHLCSTCGRGFKTRHALHIHNMIHTGEKPIRCKICSYRCRQKTALDWHITKRHPYLIADDKISDDKKRWGYNGRPPGKARTKKNSNVKVRELKSPQKQKVQAAKIQTVDGTCGWGFETQQAFNAHNLIHTGEKPIQCEHCSYRCRQRSALDWHMTRRHPHLNVDDNISDDEKWQGRPPGKTHSKKISNVKVRELKSPQKQKVQAERIQTVDSTIGQGFKTQHTFNVHNMIDTGKKPIQCEHCSYRCRQKTALDWHITRRHPHLNVDDKISDDESRQGYIDRPSGKARTKTNSNAKVQELNSPQKPKVQAERIQAAGKRRRPGRPKGKSYRKNKRSRNKAGE